ncbi:myelin and lymphocyte protein-like [Bos javanicus]|uniref:myelin and lymphocyte protein-like n=1 Tax=Bos javanicus TaxID=9906 RepID=UPI002AA8F183|nr:myelin and lymphocyte protein-like [Bos javanicus]
MATGTASGGRRLPRGSAVFSTFPDLLFIFEFAFGGLVWILILLTQVPVPLIQGWVLFVSVSCFIVTTLLLFLYIVGAHKNWNFWITLDTAYHCLAALFYFSASALETLVTIGLQDDIHKHYSENISAVVFSIIVTLLYMVHAVFSLIRCKVSYRNREHS